MKMVAGYRRHRLDSILLKMVFQMTVYHVWRERNERRHQMTWNSADQLYKRENGQFIHQQMTAVPISTYTPYLY